MINKNTLINYLLCNTNFKLPFSKSHYVTTKDIYLFKNITTIENSLTCLSNNIKGFCNTFFYK